MIKCFFVDVKNISSTVPRANFPESELIQLADLILATDGLIRPLILQESGVEKYTVIDGDREYYAAVIAKEKDITKAEMVNAFVIDPTIRQVAIEQLKLVTIDRVNIPSPILPPTVDRSIEQLLPALASLISQQLQPLHLELNHVTAQLAEHRKMLALLTDITPKSLADQPITPVKVVEPISIKVTTPQQLDERLAIPIKVAKLPSKTKASAKNKLGLDFLTAIDSPKSITTLTLINTLSQLDLSLRMQKSGITSAVKLATSIIVARNKQTEQKFDGWENIVAEVSGLAAKTAQNIIEKLR